MVENLFCFLVGWRTTAQAALGWADLRSRWISPILSLVKERTGMVASLEVIDRGLVWVLRELGLKVKEEEEERFGRKMEEDEGGAKRCHFYRERKS